MNLVLALFLLGASCAQDEELVCFKGFVMDTYCVELGVLLDNPSVETLVSPELHSYACLVDVPVCYYESGFEMLAETTAEGASSYPYGRFLRLDTRTAGNEAVMFEQVEILSGVHRILVFVVMEDEAFVPLSLALSFLALDRLRHLQLNVLFRMKMDVQRMQERLLQKPKT